MCHEPRETKHVEDVLRETGIFVSTTAGVSMYPMLRNRRDTIIVRPCYGARLNKYDVPLYKRGDKLILHRVIKVLPDSYIIRGDNCLQKEYGITDRQILGVLTGFYRDGKEIDMNGLAYRGYVRFWCAIYPLRRIYKGARRQAGRTLRRICPRAFVKKEKKGK